MAPGLPAVSTQKQAVEGIAPCSSARRPFPSCSRPRSSTCPCGSPGRRAGSCCSSPSLVMAGARFWAVTGTVSVDPERPRRPHPRPGQLRPAEPRRGPGHRRPGAEEGATLPAGAPLLKVRTAAGLPRRPHRRRGPGDHARRPRSAPSSPPARTWRPWSASTTPTNRCVAMLYVPADSASTVPVGAAGGPHRPVGADPALRRPARPCDGRRPGRLRPGSRSPRFLGDEQLGEEFSQQGRPVAVLVRLDPSAATKSGYRWSSAQGPPFRDRLHDRGQRVDPPGRAAPGRLAAPVSALVDDRARSTSQHAPPAAARPRRPRQAPPRHGARATEAAAAGPRAPRPRRAKQAQEPSAAPPSSRWRPWSAAPPRWRWCSGTTARHVPLEELRIACGVSRDGSRASNLLKAARSYGLTAKGMQMEPAALAEVQAPADPVLGVQPLRRLRRHGTRAFGRRGVHINDPDKGRRFVAMEDFDTSFTGVVLVFETGRGLPPGGRKPGVLGAMPARLRGTTGTMPGRACSPACCWSPSARRCPRSAVRTSTCS